MDDKKKMIKIDPYLHMRIFSVVYLMMAVFFFSSVFSSDDYTVTDYIIFFVFGMVALSVSIVMYRFCPIRVMTDGEKLYIRNTVTKETKAWMLSSFCAVYLIYSERRVAHLIFSAHEMSFEEQKALYKRAYAQKGSVLENTLVFIRTDKFWKKLIPEIKDKVSFYMQEDRLSIS